MRSKTDIAIVFVTLIPPTISASSETIQPVEISRRLAVSTFTAWPGSVIAVSPGKARSSRRATSDACLARLDRDADRGDLARPAREPLDRAQRQHDAEVLEAVARVVEAGDREPPPADLHRLPDVELRAVAGHRLAARAVDDDEALRRELVAGRGRRRAGRGRRAASPSRPRPRRARARPASASDSGRNERVKSDTPDWKTPEVGAADVREVAGGPVHAVRDREQRHDQADAEPDADRGEGRPRRPPQQVPPDQPGPAHRRRT